MAATEDARTPNSEQAPVERMVMRSFQSAILPIEEIDPLIRNLVIALNDAGFETTGSCEGGPGHAFELPTIVFAATEDKEETRRDVTAWLIDHGVSGFTIGVQYHHQCSVFPDECTHVRLELWSQETLRYLTF